MQKRRSRNVGSAADSAPSSIPPFRRRRRRLRLPKAISQPLIAASRHPRFWLFAGVGLGFTGSAIALGWAVQKLESAVTESVEDVLTYAPPKTLTIQAANGTILQEVGPVSHDQLKFWQIPKPIEQAFLASEDRRFASHGGVDFLGILRAALTNLQAGQVVEGGSTITQQLARIAFLSQERSLARKLKEIRLAQKIERQVPKKKIFERYLNLVYLGRGAYGISDAAWLYFSKPVDKLTIPEAATLAGIVPAPSLYSPLDNSDLAMERRNGVLDKMADAKFISVKEAEKFKKTPLTLHPSPLKRLERKAPYFTDYVRQELPKYVPQDQIEAGGLTVETTLNAEWQAAAERAVNIAIDRYGNWQRFKQGALVAIDPRTGQIKAMVGGNDYGKKDQFNRATQAQRQPGSTFKTFVYAAAMAAGLSPERLYQNSPFFVDGYEPENYGDSYSGAMMPIRSAIASSVNVVAVRTLIDVGWNPVIKLAKNMGIKSKLQPTYSLALGAWEVNLLELVSAYGTLANQGVQQPFYGIDRVRDRAGRTIYQANLKPIVALDKDSTAITTWMLQGVVNGGTGGAARLADRPVAGKTGTSDKARDLWFVGYIPQLVAGVWLGNDNNSPTSGASSTAAAIWRQFMLTPIATIEPEAFPPRPRLTGRKPTIKAEPIKPRKSYYKVGGDSIQESRDRSRAGESRANGESTPRRRRRRVTTPSSSSARTTQATPRQRRDISESPATARRSSQSSPQSTPSASTGASSPAAGSAPLAPPVGKKE